MLKYKLHLSDYYETFCKYLLFIYKDKSSGPILEKVFAHFV